MEAMTKVGGDIVSRVGMHLDLYSFHPILSVLKKCLEEGLVLLSSCKRKTVKCAELGRLSLYATTKRYPSGVCYVSIVAKRRKTLFDRDSFVVAVVNNTEIEVDQHGVVKLYNEFLYNTIGVRLYYYSGPLVFRLPRDAEKFIKYVREYDRVVSMLMGLRNGKNLCMASCLFDECTAMAMAWLPKHKLYVIVYNSLFTLAKDKMHIILAREPYINVGGIIIVDTDSKDTVLSRSFYVSKDTPVRDSARAVNSILGQLKELFGRDAKHIAKLITLLAIKVSTRKGCTVV